MGKIAQIEQTEQKYVIFADGRSPHTLKWAQELNKYFELSIISSTNFSNQLIDLIPAEKRYALNVSINDEGVTTAYFKKIFVIRKILKKIEPHYVNAHYISSHGFIMALIKRIFKFKFVFIASAWGSDVLVFPNRNEIFRRIMKFILSEADHITSDSEYMSSKIREIKDKKVLTFTFGLKEMPQLGNIEKTDFLFFSNRALTPNYNIDKIIKTFAGFQNKCNEAHLIIANDGSEKSALQRICIDLKIASQVDFIGFLSQQKQTDIYRRSTFYFSLPSSDSTSVSLLEAMAYGCIPILSDIPANREWVVNEENGLLINDHLSYDKVIFLLKNRDRIIQKNRALIKEKALFPELIEKFVMLIVSNK